MNRIILDVETAGTIEKPLVYDLGYRVVDADFNTLIERNLIIKDVFFGMRDKMETAYYANKLPQYFVEIADDVRSVVSLLDAKKFLANDCEMFHVEQLWAYNAAFDRAALNHTTKVISNGFCDWFTPRGIDWKCIQGAATTTILNSVNYFKFAMANNLVSSSGNVRTTAEACYQYLSGNTDFVEAHTGLQDVEIESIILASCLRQHKKMKTEPGRTNWRYCQKKFKDYAEKA